MSLRGLQAANPALPTDAATAEALSSQAVQTLHERIEETGQALESQCGELDGLKAENADLRQKLGILEAELVRLRKDRREMEKFLLEKIKKSGGGE